LPAMRTSMRDQYDPRMHVIDGLDDNITTDR
jgi:hypothetical protein